MMSFFDEPEYIYAITDGVYKLTEAIHSYDMDNSTVLLYSGYFGFKGESVLLLPDLLSYLKNESMQPSSGAEQNEFTLQYPISEEDCYIIYRNYFGYEMAEGSRAAPVSRSGTGKDERLIFGLYSLNPNTGGYNTAGYFVVYVNTGVCERDDFLFQAEDYFY